MCDRGLVLRCFAAEGLTQCSNRDLKHNRAQTEVQQSSRIAAHLAEASHGARFSVRVQKILPHGKPRHDGEIREAASDFGVAGTLLLFGAMRYNHIAAKPARSVLTIKA